MSDGLRFVVLCVRHDGREREFQRYDSRAEADRVAAALRRVGCPGVRVSRPDELAFEGSPARDGDVQ